MDAGQVAFAAVIASVIGPLLLAGLTNRNRRAERLEDYRRQDEVAARALKAARAVENQQRAQNIKLDQTAAALETYQRGRVASEQVTAELLLASNDQVRTEMERAHAEAAAQLEQIHLLVNSELSAAQRRERDVTISMLAAMREVTALKAERGMPPTQETLAALAKIQNHIDVLTESLAHRDAMTRLAELERAAADARIARDLPRPDDGGADDAAA